MYEHFEKIDQLKDYIREEAEKKTRFPIRFILIDNLSDWQNLIQFLKFQSEETLLLSSLCSDDNFPFIENLKDFIRKSKKNKILILPLSEYVRFYNSQILRELGSLEIIGKKRVYIPLFNVKGIFEEEMNFLSRFKSDELPPVMVLNGESLIKLYVAPFNMNLKNFLLISGIKKYFSIWEISGNNKIFLLTHLAPHINITKIIGNFEITVFHNAFEVLRGKFFNNIPIDQNWGDESQWLWLVEHIFENEQFSDFAERIINIQSFDTKLLFSKWETLDDNLKWIVWLWCKIESPKGSYLDLTLKNSTHFTRFIDDIETGVFSINLDERLLLERKKYLEYFELVELSDSFWRMFDEISDSKIKMRYLTDKTDKEKEKIILIFKEIMEKNENFDEFLHNYQQSYPDLCSYFLTDFNDTFLKDYFLCYKVSKLLDNPKPELFELTLKSANEGKIWKYSTRNSILEAKQNSNIPVFWVDGLGLEWLGLLKNLIEKLNYIEFNIEISRANFPTDTEHNKGWKNEKEVQRNLDKIGHKYLYPSSLVSEINEIISIKENIIFLLNTKNEIILTSDHGLTRFVKYGENIPIPDNAKVGPWGRYFEHTESFSLKGFDNPKFTKYNNFILCTTHDKFLGPHGPFGDIHGGATLEECLIPIIHLRKNKEKLVEYKQEITIKLQNDKVLLNVKEEGQLFIELSIILDELIIIVDSQRFFGKKENEYLWKVEIKNLKIGKHNARLKISEQDYKEFKFEIVKGIIKKDMGI